ncbi:uncharacterized protein BO80DRAFT_165092 [Aspergillus ibericus CBS 121593]|uniref:Uncharacterized protein n=1 Tax=Aspergillus ibericus CBS 121593 TaxID=1448316 RepID=A0A395GTH8_9EURO|nr:hypothetical protein BO80DRAFT_165092 [Aspergillus ibericus CBS 121593]RAK98258.1 hypothetical protein BO80DRAFT_165092 [Aspergillus ibericus CBS 121593]
MNSPIRPRRAGLERRWKVAARGPLGCQSVSASGPLALGSFPRRHDPFLSLSRSRNRTAIPSGLNFRKPGWLFLSSSPLQSLALPHCIIIITISIINTTTTVLNLLFFFFFPSSSSSYYFPPLPPSLSSFYLSSPCSPRPSVSPLLLHKHTSPPLPYPTLLTLPYLTTLALASFAPCGHTSQQRSMCFW